MASTTHLTVEDFKRLPYEQTKNCELVDGELIPVSGNNPKHLNIVGVLFVLLHPFVRQHKLGRIFADLEYDFDGNVHAPDLSYFGTAKVPLLQDNERIQSFVPDLAVEVVSPNDTFKQLVRKKDRYLRAGTREVWIVSPDSTEVYVYSGRGSRILRENDELSTDLIPGFHMRVGDLFLAE